MKKRMFALLLAALMVLSITACGSNEAPENNTDKAPAEVPAATAVPTEAAPAPVALESSGTLGESAVEIQDFEIVSDYEGNPAILVSFAYTNNAEESTSALSALTYEAYQNGLQLDSAIIMDDSVMNSEDLMKEIQTGATIEVKTAFCLISETAPVEFEMTEAFALDDARLGKVFEIAEGGVTELSVAPGIEMAEPMGDYAISVLSYRFGEDYEGKKAIIFDLGFTNNSDTTASFSFSLDFSAFQDGIELETAIGADENTGTSQLRNLKPGAGASVTVAYLLTSDTSPVEIEIEELFSFSDNKIEKTVNLAG